MSLSKHIFDRLKNDAAVSALVSTRIYPVRFPKDAAKPLITYQVQDGYRFSTVSEGMIKTFATRVQFNCIALTYGEAEEIKDAVAEAFAGYADTLHNEHIQEVNLEVDSDDDFSEISDFYRRIAIFEFIHSRVA